MYPFEAALCVRSPTNGQGYSPSLLEWDSGFGDVESGLSVGPAADGAPVKTLSRFQDKDAPREQVSCLSESSVLRPTLFEDSINFVICLKNTQWLLPSGNDDGEAPYDSCCALALATPQERHILHSAGCAFLHLRFIGQREHW